MSLRFLDSFDHYASADALEKWTTLTSPANTNPTISAVGRTGSALAWTYVSTGALAGIVLTPSQAPSGASGVCGFALKVKAVSGIAYNSSARFFGVFLGATLHWSLRLNSDGTFTVYDAAGTAVGTSSGVPVTNATWAYVEFKWTLSNTGSVTIRVNGTEVLDATSIDTLNGTDATWSSIELCKVANNFMQLAAVDDYLYIDDFYLLDGTTGTGRANNDFWGDTSVKYVAPSANGTTNEWDRTGGGSANYEAVDEATPDDDTTYLSTAVVDEVELFNLPDVTAGAYCYGVQVVVSAKKGDTGSAQVAGVVKTSGNDPVEHGAPLGVASDTAYSYYLFPWDANPDSVTDWTESDLNALEIGQKKTA